MIFITGPDRKTIVSKSQNLRGVRDYPRKAKTFVDRVSIEVKKGKDGATVSLYFGNGSTSYFIFQDKIVLHRWLTARRKWQNAKLEINGKDEGIIYTGLQSWKLLL